MSMILQLKRASDEDISRLQKQPWLIQRFLYPEDNIEDEESKAISFFEKLAIFFKRSEAVQKVEFDQYDFEELDLDKTWHALYYLLTGQAENGDGPGAYLLGCEPIGSEDVGYGPAQAISSQQTRALSGYLNSLDTKDVLARFDAQAMTRLDIYPSIWDREEDLSDMAEWLGEAFDDLRTYGQKCAQQRLGMISWIS